MPAVESGSESYSIDAASNQLAVRGGTSYTYDTAGRLLSDGVRSFGWDALGRLKTVRRNGQEVAGYGYDSQNRRVRKTVGTKTTYYLYDLENRLLAEIAGNGRVLREYVWLGQEPLALREYEVRPGLYFYINDHLGTPQQLVDSQGTVVWQSAALPFGRTQVQLGTVQNNLRFPGQYYDAETGLHYNWNRYYDPDTGRYLSPDPIGLDGGLNLYAYVGNDPVNWVDPWGLAKCTYSISKHEVICTTDDGTTGQVGPDGVFSGQDSGQDKCKNNPECADEENVGPVQPGDYDMIPSDKYGGSYWLKEGFFKRQFCNLGYGRCGFFFHEGSRSKGCITVNKNNSKAMEEFNNLKEILHKDSNNTMTVVP